MEHGNAKFTGSYTTTQAHVCKVAVQVSAGYAISYCPECGRIHDTVMLALMYTTTATYGSAPGSEPR